MFFHAYVASPGSTQFVKSERSERSGSVIVTTQRLIFNFYRRAPTDPTSYPGYEEVECRGGMGGIWNVIPRGMIDDIVLINGGISDGQGSSHTRKTVQVGGKLIIRCHDLREVAVFFPDMASAKRVFALLTYDRGLKVGVGGATSFSEDLKGNISAEEWIAARPPWSFITDTSMASIPVVPAALAGDWRVTHVNWMYQTCKSYPRTLLVPSSVTDEEIGRAAAFRSKNRFPVVEFVYINGASISRASQPKNKEDLKLLESLSRVGETRHSLVVFDARPPMSAYANYAKGGGVERYSNIEVSFLGIENIHAVRSALSDFLKEELSLSSVWMSSVSSLISGAKQCSEKVAAGNSILLHCSDGWDRTPQIASLTAIILDASSRTVEGFCALIERSWVSFGHKFDQRYGREESKREESPVFIQFLDAVWQLLVQFPAAFEFNDKLLEFLADEVYIGRFCNFRFNCQQERFCNAQQGKNLCGSNPSDNIWNHIRNFEKSFKNARYESPPVTSPLSPKVQSGELSVWYRWRLRNVIFPQITWFFPRADIPRTDLPSHEMQTQPEIRALDAYFDSEPLLQALLIKREALPTFFPFHVQSAVQVPPLESAISQEALGDSYEVVFR
ncbi:hypothetical protein GUITHDRAFT_103752 [Guillardia theta CCMP2712]|uniref:Myotubularin phosphatase domain-containing protein n=1 Tax=Guillardia theta (strain CCMP2712) TaxID=905079 RepID=L1JQP8_GUITC|nr:hypothetical protein GUITHDRAFT_103752 [Guillardia theta CCMP2712]EKX50520.1 hypothetical protein GUITHDRAFT_103752 [Guillardia theta CCMP2712]|eukprot:XP_005837500.1 hypothetical protein GUITHDRAFT_103752 [Guillardia theta CCMP2712]